MSDPYDVLGVGSHAGAEVIRQRYLELIRQHPPEQNPERFAEIRRAYEQLRDPVVSLQKRLFDVSASQTFEIPMEELRRELRQKRVPTDVLLSLAR